MNSQKIMSHPIITHDPYFNLWSKTEKLYDSVIESWTGNAKPINGNIQIDGEIFRFMGLHGANRIIEQVSVIVNATTTVYVFQSDKIELKVIFCSPLLLEDLHLVSRPISYVNFEYRSLDDNDHDIEIILDFDESITHNQHLPNIISHNLNGASIKTTFMGLASQKPLSISGDAVDIDWGHLYVGCNIVDENIDIGYSNNLFNLRTKFSKATDNVSYCRGIYAHIKYSEEKIGKSTICIGYDDIASIIYFENIAKAYWTKENKTIIDCLEEAILTAGSTLEKCYAFDNQLIEEATEIVNSNYAQLCSASYRQSIAGHKLIEDENGQVVFLSKECHSNGCIGTVDVSYPSIPLYLLYNHELVKGMIRPIIKFSKMDVWNYDFAPHDVGRYPNATGQVYGLQEKYRVDTCGNYIDDFATFPDFYKFKNQDIYKFEDQMPLEECGNMLIMIGLCCQIDKSTDFINEDWDVITKWVKYLVDYGEDPEDQLCTDDFAGHLSRNINLSAKAVMGISSYAQLCKIKGDNKTSEEYFKIAKEMGDSLVRRGTFGDHLGLTFDKKDTWSLKYNMIWDKVMNFNIFDQSVLESEVDYYIKNNNKYGVPLDSRENYGKTDWTLWASCLTDSSEKQIQLIDLIFKYLIDSDAGVPFSDWYNTENASHINFKNRTVQGGIFMPLLSFKFKDE